MAPLSGLPQPAVPGQIAFRGLETSEKPFSIRKGDSWRLSTRQMPTPGPPSIRSQEASPLHAAGKSVPVQSHALRTGHGSSSLRQGLLPGVNLGPPQGIRLLHYLDDWLILAKSNELLSKHLDQLLTLCQDLGILLNRREVGSHSHAASEIHRRDLELRVGQGLPDPSQGRKFSRRSRVPSSTVQLIEPGSGSPSRVTWPPWSNSYLTVGSA